MRSLVHKNIFTEHNLQDRQETLYDLTQTSRWLLHDAEQSLVPMVLMENHLWQLAPWHCLGQCVKEGGIAFKKITHGCEMWDFTSKNLEFNKIFSNAMACMARIVMGIVLAKYKDGFNCVRTLVDVRGGTRGMIAEIVKAHPHIKAINFDLPYVVVTAPMRQGVSHVGGDMFVAIPNADAIFMKVNMYLAVHYLFLYPFSLFWVFY
jgi:hypothetical protein